MKVLVDTNVLVRAVQCPNPNLRVARDSLRRLYQQGDEMCLAVQNVTEFWNACTRPAENNGLGHSVAATDRLVSRIETFFTILPDSLEAFRQLRKLLVTYDVKGVKVHDARLVATMEVHQISRILTFNRADFSRYPNIEVLNPSDLALPSG